MVLTFTDQALAMVLEARAAEETPGELALWLEVVGVQGGEYVYDVAFMRAAEIEPSDTVEEHGGLSVVVPEASVEPLTGATVEIDTTFGGGLAIRNPNRPTPALAVDGIEGLTGPVPERVSRVLDQLNPAIAQHGGSAELVSVEGDTAYLRLGGGCVGCGMASLTLREGIEASIRAAVPEIARVVDVTDHASGTNPYYQPA